MKALREHQETAISSLRESLRSGKKRPMLQLATGAGKTVIAAAIIRMAREKGKRCTFVVDAVSLIDQTVKAFYSEGLHGIGVIQSDHPMRDYSRQIQVASVQTLRRRGMPETDMLIIDEAHGRDKWLTQWLLDNPKVPAIGLSATPWARGLGNTYDDLIVPIDMQGLIDKGYLCSFRVFAASKPDLSKVKTLAGEYHEGQLSEVMADDGLIADAVDTWLELSERRPTLIFAVDCAHAQKLQTRFLAAGVPTEYIDAYTERADRNKIGERFKKGETKAIVSVGTMIKGVDLAVGCISDCAPTKSIMRHVQKLGRGMRVNPEAGPDLIILDHASNCLRLGFPTDIQRGALCTKEAGEKGDQEPPPPTPKECGKCKQLRPKGVKVCPNCGFEPSAAESKIEEKDGQLAEVKRKPIATLFEKQEWWSQLNYIAREKRYSSGWVSNAYRDKFGVWPQGINKGDYANPTQDVRNYVLAKQIRYAKGKAKSA